MESGGRRGLRLVGAVTFGIALVLIPPIFYVVTVLEPQRSHMTARNYRVLAETERELSRQFDRLKPIIRFSLVRGEERDLVGIPTDTASDSTKVRAALRQAKRARDEALLELEKALSGELSERVELGDQRADRGGRDSFAAAVSDLWLKKRALERRLAEARAELADLPSVDKKRVDELRSKSAAERAKRKSSTLYGGYERQIAHELAVDDRTRQLGSAQRELERELAVVEHDLALALENRGDLRRRLDELPKHSTGSADDQGVESKRREWAQAVTEYEQALGLERYLEGLRETREYRKLEMRASSQGCALGAATRYQLVGDRHHLRLVVNGCRPRLDPVPDVEAVYDVAGEAGEAESCEKPEKCEEVQVALPFSHLAEPLDDGAMTVFDQLVIVSGDGEVLHASERGPVLAADALDRLLAPARDSGSLERLARFTQIAGESGVEGGKASASRAAREVLRDARTQPQEVEIGEVWYRVFAHPMPSRALRSEDDGTSSAEDPTDDGDPPGGADAHEDEWYLVGLVSDSRFASGSFASSRSQLALAIAGFVLLLLAWPWLRLGFSGRRERLAVRHAVELVASLALGVGLVTLMAGDLVVRRSLERQTDDTARDVAVQIEQGLRGEIEASVAQLRDARRRSCPRAPVVGARRSQGRLEWWRENGVWVYPPYDVAFLLDEDGVQVGPQANFRAGDVATIRVPDRPYFTQVRDGRTWKLDTEHGVEPFFLQRIRTYDHGWRLTVVSIPVTPDDVAGTPCAVRQPVAAALTRRFDSLSSTVLPPGFGFAVVEDQTGEVLFHSDDSRSLVENFLDETGRDPRLAALVRLRRSESIDAHYRTEGSHRFTVWPLEDLPLTLVVFHESNLYDLLRFEQLIVAVVHLTLYVFGFMLVAGVVTALVQGSRWSWIWPDGRRRATYRRAICFVSLVALFYAMSVFGLRSRDLLIPIVALPAAVLGPLYLGLRRSDTEGSRGRIVAWICMTLGTAGALAVLTVLVVNGDPGAWQLLSMIALAAGAVAAAFWMLRAPFDADAPVAPRGVAYPALLVSVLAVLVVIPSLALFKDVERAQLDRLVRYGQRLAVSSAIARERGLQSDARRLHPERFAPYSEAKVVRDCRARCRGLYVRPGLLLEEDFDRADSEGSKVRCSAIAQQKPPVECGESAYTEAFSVHLTRLLPTYNNLAIDLRHVFDSGAHDDGECWLGALAPQRQPEAEECPVETGERPETREADQRSEARGTGSSRRIGYGRGEWHMASKPLDIPLPRGGSEVSLALLTGGGVAALAVWMIWFFGVRVLGTRIPGAARPEEIGLAEAAAIDRLVLEAPPGWSDRLARLLSRQARPVRRISLAGDALALPAMGASDIVLVEGLHLCLSDAPRRAAALKALESLVTLRTCRILVFSDVDPLDFIPPTASPAREGQESQDELTATERLRWAALLGHFAVARAAWQPDPLPGAARSAPPSLTRRLCEECDWTPLLSSVRDEIASDPRFASGEMSEREIDHRVADRGGAVFRRIWGFLPDIDRLALIHLAQGDLLNPRNEAGIGRLLRRGLVRRAPHYRVVSRSFALFATRAEPRARVRAWDRSAADSTWDLMRIPLVIALALILGYAIYAGRDTVDATAALIPALAAGFPAVLRLLGSMRVARTGDVGAGLA